MTTSVSDAGVPGARWRESRWLAVCDFAVVLLLFIADVYGLIPVSKTPLLIALGWISLRVRKVGWRGVGFAVPRTWGSALAFGALGGAGMVLLELFVSHPFLSRLMGRPPDLSDFQPLVGNLGPFLLTLALIWVLAALGEELVYRGYLMNRVADLGKGTRTAWMLSLIVIGIIFGASHTDQGLTGILENVINGLLLGLLYLGSGRNLVVPIIAHGVQDTVDLLLIFLGRYPGM